MIVTHPTDRQFPFEWPAWQPPAEDDGLAAIVGPGAPTGWADGLLARDGHARLVWAATGSELETAGLALLRRPGVRAVTMTRARSCPRRLKLALELAAHLADTRDGQAALTSFPRPAQPPGAVRIPHLLSVGFNGGTTDAVVWEVASVELARQWLGGQFPDQAFFEAHLDALLRLRAAARQGRIPTAAAPLTDLLHEQVLSIRLVYQHADRFQEVLRSGGDRLRR